MNKKGLTLIETLVALGLLSLVIVATMRLFVAGIKAQVRSNEMNIVNSESSFLLDRIAREIRMAKSTTSMIITNPGYKIDFINHDNLATVYCRSNDLGTACQNSGSNLSVSYAGGGAVIPINSPSVEMTGLKFVKSTAGQTAITILLELRSRKDPTANIKLQTTVIPRVY